DAAGLFTFVAVISISARGSAHRGEGGSFVVRAPSRHQGTRKCSGNCGSAPRARACINANAAAGGEGRPRRPPPRARGGELARGEMMIGRSRLLTCRGLRM